MFICYSAWGENLFSANNEDWRRHRRVVAPAFTPKTYNLQLYLLMVLFTKFIDFTSYAMVWKETRILYRDMCASERWSEKREFIVNNINRLPLKVGFSHGLSSSEFALMTWTSVLFHHHLSLWFRFAYVMGRG